MVIRIFTTEIDAARIAAIGRGGAEKEAVANLLREAFPDNPDVTIGHLPSGAPYLVGSDEVISISHCKGMAAVALAPAGVRLGIDCETPDRHRQLEKVKTRFLSPSQVAAWEPFPQILHAWCIKEAVYKAALRPGLPLTDIPLPTSSSSSPSSPASPSSSSSSAASSSVSSSLIPLSDCGPSEARTVVSSVTLAGLQYSILDLTPMDCPQSPAIFLAFGFGDLQNNS